MFISHDCQRMDNFVIKVFDKDDTFKRTLSWKDINGDIKYRSVLNNWFSDMKLKIQNKLEEQTETSTYYYDTFLFDWTDDYIVSDSTVSATAYNGTVSGGVTIVGDAIGFNWVDGYLIYAWWIIDISVSNSFTVNLSITTSSDITTSQVIVWHALSSSDRFSVTLTW